MELSQMYKKKKNRWSISKIELLIDLWAEHYRELKSCRRNDHVFVKMKHKLEKSGCKVTVEDIRIRINNLSAKYRKESMLTLSGGSPSRWPLFNKIHNILSNDAGGLDETVETQEESMEETPESKTKVYQLKCNYRHENIDNFFTDLYFNPRYADVTLVTCHDGETFAIPAHRMVLGNFSMYFANIFDKLNVPQNSNTYIVLPGSISHQTMQILMQYMYTGQSSVPEYNVDDVLRSGELLKIRGFWSESRTGNQQQQSSSMGNKRRAPGAEPRKMHYRQPGTSSQESSEPSRQVAGRSALTSDLQTEMASDSGTSALDALDEQKRLAIAAIQRDLHASSMRAMAHGAAALFSSSLSDVKQEPTEWDDLDDDNDSDEDVMILPEEAVKAKLATDGKPSPSAQISQAAEHYSLQHQPQPQLLVGQGPENDRQQLPEQSHSSHQQQPIEPSLSCDLCSSCFTNTDHLLQHIISSHGDASEETPLNNMRCDFCGKFFTSAVDWAQHVLQVHNDRTAELQQQMAQFSVLQYKMSRRVVRTKNRWTTAQLELLVAVWEKYYQHLKAGRGHEEIYEMMVDELKAAGCVDATVKQVRGRIHNLSGKYRKEASEVQRTGIPSQWTLYSKISKFFEYTAPLRFKNLGPPVYDMSEYLDLDLVMAETIERRTSNRKKTGQNEYPREFELDENSLDMEDDELEPDEDSVDVDHPDQEEYSDAVQYDDEFPVRKGAESVRSDEEQADVKEEIEPERAVPKQSVPEGTDLDTDSFMDDDEPSFAESSNEKSNKVFHFKSSFRQAAIEDFLSQLYSVLGALKPNSNGNPLTVCLQPDISQPVMQLLLQFMYTGKASVAGDLLGDFLRCGHILRIRGVWSEEKAESADERRQQPSDAGGARNATNDDVSVSSLDEEDGSSAASSTVTVISKSQKHSSDDTRESSDRSRKRRKRVTRKAKRMRHQSDQESVNSEVSSEIGYDLLRSDTENEDNKRDKSDAQTNINDAGKGTEDHAIDKLDRNSRDDDDDDDGYDEDDEYGEDSTVDEDEDFGTEYIESDDGTNTDFDVGSIANGGSVSNVSIATAITPDPVTEPTQEPESVSEKENIHHNDRIEQNGNVNGCSPNAAEAQQSTTVYGEERLEHETPVSVKSHPKVQATPGTKPPDMRHTIQKVPSLQRIQQSTVKKLNSQTPHSSGPERRTSQQGYAIQSTSRSHLQPKVRSVYSCKICGARFSTSDGWVEHVVYTHSNGEQLMDGENNSEGHLTMLQCDLCSKYLGSEYDWVHHILKKHTERYPHFHEELSMSDE
uniref:BTB domain-containing protein n=1 Tax=Anopheles culicifacies TaxID=139723 RepID=A0A182MKU6_9DIPT